MTRAKKMHAPITDNDERLEVFLEFFANSGRVKEACAQAGLSYTQMRAHRTKNPIFQKQYDVAYDMSNELLEDEAVRRGTEGVLEPVYYRGQRVGRVRKYSDPLLILLMKGRMRKIYGDQLGLSHDGQIAIKAFNYDEAIQPISDINATPTAED